MHGVVRALHSSPLYWACTSFHKAPGSTQDVLTKELKGKLVTWYLERSGCIAGGTLKEKKKKRVLSVARGLDG